MKKLIIGCLLLSACASKTPARVQISLVDHNRSLKISGIEYTAIAENGNDTSQAFWQTVIPVYKMPADTDMKNLQPVQHGKYMASGADILFTPDTPFVKNQQYFTRYYDYSGGEDVLRVAKSGGRLGNAPYIELIFRY